MKKIIIATALITGTFISCKTPKETASVPTPQLNCSDKTFTFNADIKPILETSCTKCHNTNNKAGFNFYTYESAKKAAESGELLGTIKHLKGFRKMPAYAGKLDQAIIDKIECWVNNGMKQ